MAETDQSVLLIEDEIEIRELMALHLLRQGYKVKECGSIEDALTDYSQNKYALIVLDWMLPGMSGIEFLDYLSKKNETKPHVLMVTARTEPQDIIQGLEKGADDYLTKPFDANVFLARVKALLRRGQLQQSAAGVQSETVQLGELKIQFDNYEVFLGSEKLHLTPSEYKLLICMVQNRGKVLTRDQLIEEIQGEGVNVIGRTVDTHVFGLRKKLGEWGDQIETIRGIGYRVKI